MQLAADVLAVLLVLVSLASLVAYTRLLNRGTVNQAVQHGREQVTH